MTAASPSAGSDERDFVISRVFDAPRELVFEAWTQREHLVRWWGPKGFAVVACSIDLRPGGVFHYGLRTPNGQEMWGKWIFREIVAPERLVFVSSFSDAQGGTVRAPFDFEWPLEMLSTVTFEPRADGTEVTVRWSVPSTATEAERRSVAGMHDSMRGGWTGTFEQLARHLADATEGDAG